MINRRLSSRMIFEGRIINLRVDDVELPDGRRSTREIVEHPGAVVIIPVDDQGQVYFVRQYRDAIEESLLELPAGKLDPGEEPERCARRELLEELGMEAGRWQKLATFYSSPGFCDEIMHAYLAEDLTRGRTNADREEFLQEETRPLEPVGKLAAEIRDGKSLAGILLAHKILEKRS